MIKLQFDSNQECLSNLGQPVTIPLGNGIQSPSINRLSANYIEISPTETKPLLTGTHEWVKVSLAYQEGQIKLLVSRQDITKTFRSFVG